MRAPSQWQVTEPCSLAVGLGVECGGSYLLNAKDSRTKKMRIGDVPVENSAPQSITSHVRPQELTELCYGQKRLGEICMIVGVLFLIHDFFGCNGITTRNYVLLSVRLRPTVCPHRFYSVFV